MPIVPVEDMIPVHRKFNGEDTATESLPMQADASMPILPSLHVFASSIHAISRYRHTLGHAFLVARLGDAFVLRTGQ